MGKNIFVHFGNILEIFQDQGLGVLQYNLKKIGNGSLINCDTIKLEAMNLS